MRYLLEFRPLWPDGLGNRPRKRNKGDKGIIPLGQVNPHNHIFRGAGVANNVAAAETGN